MLVIQWKHQNAKKGNLCILTEKSLLEGMPRMNTSFVYREILRIVNKYEEWNPYKICDAMGIIVKPILQGTYKGACKGFYMCQSWQSFIAVNRDLPEEVRRIIVAHELGHAVLHKKIAGIKTFHDVDILRNTTPIEYEANIFAANLLLPDELILEKLNDDLSFFEAAALLRVPAELLDIKFQDLKRRGYKIAEAPLMAHGDFLKRDLSAQVL